MKPWRAIVFLVLVLQPMELLVSTSVQFSVRCYGLRTVLLSGGNERKSLPLK